MPAPGRFDIRHCFQNDGRQTDRLPQFAAKTDWREAEQRRSMRVQIQFC
jgi:hypothetical protein